MRLSESAYSMASLILKHNPIIKPKEQSIETTKRDNKYSLDYTAFEKIPAEEQKEIHDAGLTQFAHYHDKSKERELYEKSTKQKLENAAYFKDQGNAAYTSKQFDKAAYMYEKAIVHFDYTFPDNPKDEKTMKELQQKCHMNLALCHYQMKNNDEALSNLRQVLLLNPQNTKALFRQAVIAFDREEFQQCKKKIQETEDALKGAKNDQLDSLKLKLANKEKKYEKKIREVASKMF